MNLEDADTSAEAVDLATAERNVATVRTQISGLGPNVRPHIKTHPMARMVHAQMDRRRRM